MSLLRSLFQKEKQADIHFINPVKTELHSHLIPAIDDGVSTLEQSIVILRRFSELGYTKVITTPHIMGDFYQNGPFNILPKLEEVRAELRRQNIPIELHAAAEYMVDEALEDKIEKKELLAFGNNYVLIELPFTNEPVNLQNILFALQVNGYQPVLAHPERYLFMGQRKNRYEELFQSGVLFQINLFSLVGYYSPQVQKNAEFLIRQKMVNLVGSDTHAEKHLDIMTSALKSYNYQKVCELDLLNNNL